MTRDDWGRVVRSAWVTWSREQPFPERPWGVTYEDLSEEYQQLTKRIAEAVLSEAETEGARLVKERARLINFIASDAWGAMNERRAELIDRDVQDGGSQLTDVEKAELATIETAVDVIIGIAHPLPFENVDKGWETMFRVVDEDNKRLKAALRSVAQHNDRACRMAAVAQYTTLAVDLCRIAKTALEKGVQ